MRKSNTKSGKIRIIGGIHRSRLLPVLDYDGLRPTLDRVKETVFNWLGQELSGKTCLDLFAGSGSLGFEALSRNALKVVMVEQNPSVVAQLQSNQKLLAMENCQIVRADALSFIQTTPLTFDIIFLDPPYHTNLLTQSLSVVSKVLKPGGVIYLEYTNPPPLAGWQVRKQALAGQVKYALLTTNLE